MGNTVFIAIDDTDILGSKGTGHYARGLASFLQEQGFGSSLGITRHQLLVDPRIPYTSHNSSLCIGFDLIKDIGDLRQPCIDFLKNIFNEGSDPGLCIASKDQITDELINFGHKAETVVLKKRDAIEMAAKHNILLMELGGTGDGIIGSLAGIALRGGGNGGRFVDLPGIRNITGIVTVAQIKQTTAISSIEDIHGNLLDSNDLVNSLDWLRPTLLRGEPVLRVRPEKVTSGKRIWFSLEVRHDKDKQKVNN